MAGLKAYTTNIENLAPQFLISAYHQLWHVETSCRMSKHDLRATPIYHRKRDSIQAHLSVVFAALAIARLIEARTMQIRAGNQIITAADPLPDDLRNAHLHRLSPFHCALA